MNDLEEIINNLTNAITELERDIGSTLAQEYQVKINNALPHLYNARALLTHVEHTP